ncbi:hypothetical protein BJY00DRAFT_319398 [Aspergillus carlsbadensis]|nr:hypothetical protein BJY00DRAFT_319398 [Aspergillus carlsbadensis]
MSAPHNITPTGILALPDELLLLIFDDLIPDDEYYIARPRPDLISGPQRSADWNSYVRTLQAISLTCRYLRPIGQEYLYRTIRVLSQKQLYQLDNTITHAPYLAKDVRHLFLWVCQNYTPLIERPSTAYGGQTIPYAQIPDLEPGSASSRVDLLSVLIYQTWKASCSSRTDSPLPAEDVALAMFSILVRCPKITLLEKVSQIDVEAWASRPPSVMLLLLLSRGGTLDLGALPPLADSGDQSRPLWHGRMSSKPRSLSFGDINICSNDISRALRALQGLEVFHYNIHCALSLKNAEALDFLTIKRGLDTHGATLREVRISGNFDAWHNYKILEGLPAEPWPFTGYQRLVVLEILDKLLVSDCPEQMCPTSLLPRQIESLTIEAWWHKGPVSGLLEQLASVGDNIPRLREVAVREKMGIKPHIKNALDTAAGMLASHGINYDFKWGNG